MNTSIGNNEEDEVDHKVAELEEEAAPNFKSKDGETPLILRRGQHVSGLTDGYY